jgi:hypothetical protein
MPAVIAGLAFLFSGVVLSVCAVIWLGKLMHREASGGLFALGAFPIIVVTALACVRIAPLFARVRIAQNGEVADFPLSRYRHG